MTRPALLAGAGLTLVALVTAWFLLGPREERLAIDLIEALPTARQVPKAFEVADLELGGRTRRALVVNDYGRFIFPVTVPERAWLRLSVGQRAEAWTTEGDGVLFIVGMWDEVVFDEVLTYVVNPFHLPEDRIWHDIAIDLSKYAGRTLELRLILRRRDTERGDAPAWGNPRIVTR